MNLSLSTAENFVRELAESFGPKIGGFYRYLIDNLDSGKLEPLTHEEQAYVDGLRKSLRKRFQAQQCFCNAQTLATYSDGRIKYHEGIFMDLKLPVPLDHAWNTINGKIVDLTVLANARRNKRVAKAKGEKYKPREYSYCGVQYSVTEIQKAQLASEVYTQVFPYAYEAREAENRQINV